MSGWRWDLQAPYVPEIHVIEPPDRRDAPKRRKKTVKTVPFGFGRAIKPNGKKKKR